MMACWTKLALAAWLAVQSAGCASDPDDGGGDDTAEPPPAICIDGTTEHAVCDVLGTQSRQCALGQWSDYSACTAPPWLVIPVPLPSDMVHDAKRHRLYIASHDLDGLVLSYDLATRRWDAPLLSGGAFYDLDMSPDGDQLIVTDGTIDDNRNWVHVIALATRTARKLAFEREVHEFGTTSAVFTSDAEALVTTDGFGSVPLRRVDLTMGVAEPIRSVEDRTSLVRSADGSVVAYAEPGLSSGPWGRYDVAERRFASAEANASLGLILVDRTGSQFALRTRSVLSVFDANLAPITTLGDAFPREPVGAAYSPVTDELYIAWSGGGASIEVYSSTSFDKLRDLAPEPGLFPGNAWTGRLEVSRDGRMVFAITSAGVAIYPTGR